MEEGEIKKKEDSPTGSYELDKEYKIIVYPLDKYQIKIKLTLDDKFIEVMEVVINKDFLSYKQRISHQDFHDIDEFYTK